jgi:hypothetical protein
LLQQYYCYKSDCPARTPEKPYPHGECRFMDGFKLPNGDIVGKAPKSGVKCPYCKRKMTAVVNMNEEY